MSLRTWVGGRVGRGLWAMLLGVVLLATSSAQAVPLNLVSGRPDFLLTGVALQYTAATDLLQGGGRVATLTLPGGSVLNVEDLLGTPSTFGSLAIMATIDDLGVATSATLTIKGTVPDLAASGTLLQGSLALGGFGVAVSPSTSSVLEFVFNTDPGSVLAAQFGPKFQMILNTGGPTFNASSFGGDFATMPFGSADVSAVPTPEPLTASLGGTALGLLGVSVLRRRSR